MSPSAATAPAPPSGLPGPKAATTAILERFDRVGQSCATAYLSFADPRSCVALYESDGTCTPLIEFLELPAHGSELFKSVAGIDESGSRLVTNYRSRFAEDAERLDTFEPALGVESTSALGWLFVACSLVLGLDEQDVGRALEPSVEHLGLDTFVIEIGGRYLLDGRRLLRSVMSYRIGGAAAHAIARSLFVSLGSFVGDATSRVLREWHLDLAVLGGDLFAGNEILRHYARGSLVPSGARVLDPVEGDPDSYPSRPYGASRASQGATNSRVSIRERAGPRSG
ncbi:MAG TPA: hypothetical protein VMV53_07020 [Acidimicrobiales bacterium]|nr:hypothetical protein [Acidimicrobiales bacterium]